MSFVNDKCQNRNSTWAAKFQCSFYHSWAPSSYTVFYAAKYFASMSLFSYNKTQGRWNAILRKCSCYYKMILKLELIPRDLNLTIVVKEVELLQDIYQRVMRCICHNCCEHQFSYLKNNSITCVLLYILLPCDAHLPLNMASQSWAFRLPNHELHVYLFFIEQLNSRHLLWQCKKELKRATKYHVLQIHFYTYFYLRGSISVVELHWPQCASEPFPSLFLGLGNSSKSRDPKWPSRRSLLTSYT